MTRIVVHVGLPKTGSTALQEHVFPRLAGLDYLGPKGVAAEDRQRAHAGRRVVDALRRDARALAHGDIGDLGRVQDWVMRRGGTVLLSEEGLTSNARAQEVGFDPIPLIPAAIRTIFPDATVVLVLREPTAWIGSMLLQRMFDWPTYRSGSAGDRPIDPLAYIDFDLTGERRGTTRTIFGTVARFDRTVAAYRAAFPADRLHVLAFERLFGPDEGWRDAFAGVLGVPVDVPSPPRANETTDDKRRNIAARFFPGDGERIERFAAAWRDIVAVVRSHPGAMAALEAHAMGPWKAAMAAGAGPAIAPPRRIGDNP